MVASTVYSGSIDVSIPGDLDYSDLSVPIGEITPHKSELLLFGGDYGEDLGNMPNSARNVNVPFLTVKENVFSTYEHDIEQNYEVEFDANVSAGTRGTEATYTFVSTAALVENMVIRNMTTNEQFLVTEIVSATQAKLQPGFSRYLSTTGSFPGAYTNDTPQAVADGQKAEIVGIVQADGGQPATWKYTKPTRRVNNIQTVSTKVEIDGAQLDQEAGMKLESVKFDKRIIQMTYDFMRKAERMGILGQQNIQTIGSNVYRTSEGIYDQISNVYNVSALDGSGTALDNDNLAHIGELAGERTSVKGYKVALTSNVMLRKLNKLAEDNNTINMNPGDDEIRLKTFKVKSQFQDLEFVEHPLFSKIPALKDHIMVLDLENVIRVNLQGAEPRLFNDVLTKDYDKRQDFIRGRIGCLLAQQQTHFIFKGFETSFA